MSKTKKIVSLILIVITILGVFTISNSTSNLDWNISNLKNSDIGKVFEIDTERYYNSDDMFCIERGQALRISKDPEKYELEAKVTIEGTEATAYIKDKNNKLVEKTKENFTESEKKANAKFGYILSREYIFNKTPSGSTGGYNTHSQQLEGFHKSYSDKQNAIWDYGYDWWNLVGQDLSLKQGLITESEYEKLFVKTEDNQIMKELKDIGSDIVKQTKLEDNTTAEDKKNIKVVNYKSNDGTEYLRIGPFNWKFGEKLKSIYLYDQNNERISHKLYSQYNGTEQQFIELNEIKSEKNFYVYIPNNGKVTKITKIEGKTAPTINKVNIWFFEHLTNAYQNIISVDYEKVPSEIALKLNLSIKLTGGLKVIKVDKDNNTVTLKDVEFKIQNKETGKYVKKSSSGEISYVSKESDATVFKTDKKGEISINNLVIGTYVAYETKNPDVRYEIIKDGKEKKVTLDKTAELKIENERITLGEFILDKHDSAKKDLKLPNVKFTIKMTEGKYKGKYVNIDKNGKAKYQDEKCELVTDKNGKITIKDMYLGKYHVKETANGNYGYEKDYDKEVTLDKEMQQKGDKYTLSVPNVQKYVKLSGYVWVDRHDENKQTLRNDLCDKGEELLSGITVRLRKGTEKIAETTTNSNGAYIFENVPIAELDSYYVDFQYDGYKYQNVTRKDAPNGSKAEEKPSGREEFNNKFTTIEGNTINTGKSLDEHDDIVYDLEYKRETSHKSEFINKGEYTIRAYTKHNKKDHVGDLIENYHYNLKEVYNKQISEANGDREEIKNINLGLYERAEPDISLVQDLYSVNLSINGYNNVYNYQQRLQHGDDIIPTENDLNVGVKYKERPTGSYTRPIYEADYQYRNENDINKELKVYLTYKIRIINETTSLKVKVNSIVDYFDSNYTFKGYGTSVDAKGNINDIKEKEADKNYNQNGYKKVLINTNTILEGQQYDDIYVQFELNREAVQSLMTENKEELNNVAEINSYSVIGKDGKAYAGIDKDSNPGNAIPGIPDTYEDDTDAAPSLKLETTDARKITGAVFVDKSEGEAGKVRLGNGKYDKGEVGIEGVEVKLTEISGADKEYTATTKKDGTFEISNFIPGDYTLTYTWGDDTYTVQNYKGTIYEGTVREEENYRGIIEEKDGNKYLKKDGTIRDNEWYKVTDPRFSDALDDYNTRIEIDKQMLQAGQNIETTQKITKMNSTTPVMAIGIENIGTETASKGNKYEFIIKNVDFGIVERAKQEIDVDKTVKTLKATLANGQVIVDATIEKITDKNGDTKYNITGQNKGVTAVKGEKDEKGFVTLLMDKELIQGATIEVGYEIKVINNSELDYTSKEFYHYGREGKEEEKVKITPSGIVDYLDKDWGFDAKKNEQWQIKTVDEIKGILAEKVYLTEDSEINNKYILYTESLKDKKIAPEESESVMLNVSKILSTSEDITLDNETEVVKIDKTGGSQLIQIPGDYIPGRDIEQKGDTAKAEEVIVLPHTGANMEFLPYIILGMSTLIILGAGIIFIKKKVLK